MNETNPLKILVCLDSCETEHETDRETSVPNLVSRGVSV